MRALPRLLSAMLLAAVLTGCAAGRDEGEPSPAGDALPGSAVGEAPDTAGGTGGGATGGRAGGATGGVTLENLRVAPARAVIRTGHLHVRVDDVAQAAAEATQVATSVGGAVEAEQRSASTDGGSATLVLRIPPDELEQVVTRLAALGDERDRELRAEDVTERVLDVEARLATQEASVARVRALLAEAETLGEVVQIEAELSKRTADLESLQAQLESLTARLDLATLTLRLDREGGLALGEALGFGDGVQAGWAALTTAARLAAVTAGALLPFLPLVLVAALVAHRVRSRRPPPVDA